tara:strand:+ start:1084 stop:1320 length:237 start_codon:yes stop_codon:yes gene_type:complete
MDRQNIKTRDPLVQRVLKRMAERSESGIKKFGNTMDKSEQSLEHWITNTQEELADSILYLEKLKDEIRKKEILWTLKN